MFTRTHVRHGLGSTQLPVTPYPTVPYPYSLSLFVSIEGGIGSEILQGEGASASARRFRLGIVPYLERRLDHFLDVIDRRSPHVLQRIPVHHDPCRCRHRRRDCSVLVVSLRRRIRFVKDDVLVGIDRFLGFVVQFEFVRESGTPPGVDVHAQVVLAVVAAFAAVVLFALAGGETTDLRPTRRRNFEQLFALVRLSLLLLLLLQFVLTIVVDAVVSGVLRTGTGR